MKVLFIANCMGMYGANRSMIELAIALREKNCELYFIFPQQGTAGNQYKLKSQMKTLGFSCAFINYSGSVYRIEQEHWYEKNFIKRLMQGVWCLYRSI